MAARRQSAPGSRPSRKLTQDTSLEGRNQAEWPTSTASAETAPRGATSETTRARRSPAGPRVTGGGARSGERLVSERHDARLRRGRREAALRLRRDVRDRDRLRVDHVAGLVDEVDRDRVALGRGALVLHGAGDAALLRPVGPLGELDL